MKMAIILDSNHNRIKELRLYMSAGRIRAMITTGVKAVLRIRTRKCGSITGSFRIRYADDADLTDFHAIRVLIN